MKKISLLLIVPLIFLLGACTTPYVKDISPLASEKVAEKTPEITQNEAENVTVDYHYCTLPVIKGTVLFDFNSYKIDAVAKTILEKIAVEICESPDKILLLKGHTDKVGSHEFNQILSENRADAVEDYLVQAGISADRFVSVLGYGKTLLLPNASDHENRRVVIMTSECK